jgi:solute carrier family 25 carnitine/acylcarnitine transporter 20/29
MEWLQVHFIIIAGWSQVFVMQPFEIIKVRLQTQSATNKMYNGIVDCLTKIIKNEGFFALYKGNYRINLGSVTPLVGVGIMGSMRFGLYENFKKIFAEKNGLSNAG